MIQFPPPLRAAACALVAALLVCSHAIAGLAEATDHDAAWSFSSASGMSSWVGQAAVTMDGVDCAAGRLTGFENSWMETTVTGPTTLYFSYRVVNFATGPRGSLDPDRRGFFLVIGGVSRLISDDSRFGSDSGWQEVSAVIPSGEQVVRWELATLGDESPVLAYVDQVWTSDDPRPRITSAPAQTLEFSKNYSWTVPVAPDGTLTAAGLPPGLTVNGETHVISGYPTAAGSFQATLTVTNPSGRHVDVVPFTVAPRATPLPGALDAPSLQFTQPRDATIWAGVEGLGHDGVDCARASGGGFDVSYLQTEVTGPGVLKFWYRSEVIEGKAGIRSTNLNFYIGPRVADPPPNQQFHEKIWTEVTVPVRAGPQFLSWSAQWSAAGAEFPPGVLHVYLDEVSFTPQVIGPQSTFADWVIAWNVEGLPLNTDTDQDGLTLIMEYATGGSPLTPDPGLAPKFSIVDGYFTIEVKKAQSPSDLIYFIQGSRVLSPNAWTTSTVEVLDEDDTRILARCKKNTNEEPLYYLRARVLVAP